MLPPMYAEAFTKYRRDQLHSEGRQERLAGEARQGPPRTFLPKKPAYCCITGNVRNGFELRVEGAA